MARPSYNDNQIEAENLLRSSLGQNVDQSTIDEIISMLGKENRRVPVTDDKQRDTETILKLRLKDEPDPLKRAAISAMIISNNLEI